MDIERLVIAICKLDIDKSSALYENIRELIEIVREEDEKIILIPHRGKLVNVLKLLSKDEVKYDLLTVTFPRQ